MSQSFIVGEEEELIPLDWTTQCPTKLILYQRRFHPGTEEWTVCVQNGIAEIFVSHPMVMVASAVGSRVDHRSRGTAIFSAVIVGLDFELLNRIRRWDDRFVGISLVRSLISVVI